MTERYSRREFLRMCGLVAGAFFLPRMNPMFSEKETRELESTLVESLVFLPGKTEKCTGNFTSGASLVAEDFPLYFDRNYNLDKPVTILKLPSGLNFRFDNLYYFRDPSSQDKNQEIVRATILSDTMGTHDLMTAILDRGKFDYTGKYLPTLETYKGIEGKNDDIYGEITYWVGYGTIYPNKIFNLLTAFSNILKYQEKNGSLKEGRAYSYLDLIQLSSSNDYISGYNSGHMEVRAGGVCAGATALANAIYRMAEKAGKPFERTYIKPKYSHDLRYPLGFFAPPSYITDTTVKIDSDGEKWDFRMVPPADCYISPRFCLIPNGVPTQETPSDGLGILLNKEKEEYLYSSDVNLLLNVAFTKSPPKETSDSLLQIWKAYSDFRELTHKNNINSDIEKMSGGGQLVGSYKWEEKKPYDIIQSIFPSVDLDRAPFSEEINTSPYLQEAFTLMQILNSLDQDSCPDVAAFLRNSGWYREKQQNGSLTPAIENGIDQLSFTKIQGQPVQCIQWVNLLASLGYADSPLDIGVVVRGPNNLIPNKLLEGSYRKITSSPTGGVLISDSKLKIEEIKAGNLFLKKNSYFGHVGTFLAAKDVDGKRLVLTTDANRVNNGRVRIFTIDDRNFDALLGAPPNKKIILVKNNS